MIIDKITNLAQDLIRIPSTADNSPALGEVISYITKYATSTDLSVKSFAFSGKPSLIISFNEKKPQVILNGHADVVPGQPHQFQPTIKDGKLYGRGADDMKASLAAMLVLMKNLKNSHPTLPVQLMVVTDEEIGGHLGTKKLVPQKKGLPDLFLAGESTSLKIEYQSKGVVWLKLKTSGRRSHGARPWDGQNAIVKLAKELVNINKMYPEPQSPFGKLPVTLAPSVRGQQSSAR